MQMNDPTLFAIFLENVLQVRPSRVRDEVITFVETFKVLLSSSDDEIDAFSMRYIVATVTEPLMLGFC